MNQSNIWEVSPIALAEHNESCDMLSYYLRSGLLLFKVWDSMCSNLKKSIKKIKAPLKMPTMFKLWQHGLFSIYWCTFSNQQSFCQVLLIECLKHIFTCMEMGAKHAWSHTFYLYHGTSGLWHKPLSWHVDQQINIHYATAKKNMQTISS